MLFNSPFSSEKADRLIGLLPLDSESRVLDVGCGTGEILVRVIEKFSAQGTGIDIDPTSLEIARRKAEDRDCAHLARFVESSIGDFESEAPFDCGICLGATHAFSLGEPAYPEALKALHDLVAPEGYLLVGESYWIQSPDPDYLAFVGEPGGTYRSHRENVELAESLGWQILYATTSSLDEWDDFEWSHHLRIEAEAKENPDNPNAIEKRDRCRAWRKAYLEWGRGTLGFGFYLFRRES